MLISAFIDVSDTTLGLGSIIVGDGTHSNIIVPVAGLRGLDADGAETPLMMHSPVWEYAIRSRDGLDVEVARKLSRGSLGSVLSAALVSGATTNSWTDPTFLVAELPALTGRYAIGYFLGGVDISITFTTAAGAAFMGYAFPTTLGNEMHVGIAVPTFVIKPMLTAVSNPTPDRETETVASFAISDDGRNGYGLSREGCSVEREWVQQWEPVALVEPINAVSTHPWTHRHLFRHCRQGLPFVVNDGGFGNAVPELFHLRGEGTAFEAKYASPNYSARRNIEYQTYVMGAIIAT